MPCSEAVRFAPDVRDALASGQPVVALETAIVTHGMPRPLNLETARAVEADIRDNGAIPATIAVIDGQLVAGLTPDELERLAAESTVIQKASAKDLGRIMATSGTAGTTVAATMRIASLAGIDIFATGGIGGVHQGVEQTGDISADLTELGQTPVGVVCAGAKSILDLPRTLEFLETAGVPVLGYRTQHLPAFFTPSSGLPLDAQIDTPEDIADTLRMHWSVGGAGAVICNPIDDADGLPGAEMDEVIGHALAEAKAQGITGKAVTPFLLGRVLELTDGRSLKANVQLVRSNARLAARIAVAMAARGAAA